MSGAASVPARYLSPSEVVRLARRELGTVARVDHDALYLALRRTAEGEPTEVATRIHEFAAALLEGLISFHPFTDHNEHVARLAVVRFYELNGWALEADDEVARLADDMQSGRASVFAGAAVLARHARRAPP